MKRVIIDCDPGNGIAGANVDDGLALAIALGCPSLTLELITTVAGNTAADIGFNVAKDLVDELGVSVAVIKGAMQPLVEPQQPWRDALDKRVHLQGLNALWQGVRQPRCYRPPARQAANAIGELICAHPGEITLVATGPLTNVALALAHYPLMATAVREIIIMGGVFALDDFIKDTNFGFDPEAAQQVLTSGAKITLAPLDVTTQTLIVHDDLDRIAALNTPLARFVVETLRPWLSYSMQTRRLAGSWIHDALVVAWLHNPQVATAADYYVNVETRAGQTRGKAWRYCLPLRIDVGITPPSGAPIRVLQSVDNALLLSIIHDALARPAKAGSAHLSTGRTLPT